MKKIRELYRGKAKSIFSTDDKDLCVMWYRDDTTAFDGKKSQRLDRKGAVNNMFNAFIMQKLEAEGIKTHFVERLSADESLVKRLKMFPLECVVRNVAAGSMCRRLGVQEGLDLEPPTFEFFLKNDALGDPMINEYHIRSFKWADDEAIAELKRLTFAVNTVLKKLFADAGMILVDYKLEFGKTSDGAIVLGDEFTPDGCRIWDAQTRTKLDKDRFRQDLGDVVESYEWVGRRLGVNFDDVVSEAD